jgi:two-component system, chemotaxis family, CheB/CheR fusion protein
MTSDSSTRHDMAADDFLIVGLGASAGGIKAFRAFFEQVPPNSGMAYVVILHLSPEYESRLPEVLQRSASIPVIQVNGRLPVEPNRVYVLPPNQSLAMVDGHLELSPITRIEERRAPIDIFFRTLADCQGPRAASIVLSGTGADGSMGMKRVKEHGGVCFVQDPREAEHEDMPLHSIATGLADYVLPVADMPAKLLAYSAYRTTLPPLAERIEQPLADASAMRSIFTHLRVQTGHDFSSYKPATMLRRLERRMRVGGISTLADYAALLRANADEPQALLKDLLISVTNFFRDTKAFEALDRLVMPRLLEGKGPEDQIRAWVAGCATGEEAYSIAMLLAEHTWGMAGAPAVLVFATDIDTDAIATAREGYYTATDTADVSADRLARFFVDEAGGYRVRKELRSLVLFANHNVIKDPPFSHLDLVSCRNLLIYLNRTMQRRVMDVVHFALDPGRYLFLGNSESMDGAGDLFITLDRDAHVFESRSITARTALPIPDVTRHPPSSARTDAFRMTDARRAERLSYADLHQELLEQYGPPSVVVDEEYEILHLSARAGRYLRFGGGEPTRNILRTIKPELRLELRTALYQAAQQRTNVEAQGLSLRIDDAPQTLTITVKPVLRQGDPVRGFFLIFFEEHTPAETETPPVSEQVAPAAAAVHHLEDELQRVKEQLRSTTEQYEAQTEELKASNEELQAINEELRSSAEELETSKEELQSINEELTTVNQELKIKIEEQSQSHNDILNLVNSTEIGTLFIDRDFRIKLFTPSVRKLFNLIPSDLGRPLSDIASSLENADLADDISRVLQRLEPVEREIRARADAWYVMRVIPYRTADDRIDGVVMTFVEITSRKVAEEKLRESVDRLRMAAGAAGMYSWELDLGLQTFKYYTSVERVLGFPLPVAVAEAVAFVHPEDRAAASDALAQAIASGGEFAFDQRFVTPSGGSVWTRTSGLVLRDAAGHPVRAVGTTQNVDDAKRNEETLRRSEQRLRRALEIETVGVMHFNRNGVVFEANDAFLRMSGYTRADVQAGVVRWDVMTSPQWLPEFSKKIDELMTTGRTGASEKEYIRKDGTRWWGLYAETRLSKDEGVEYVIDVGEQRRAEERLRESETRQRLILESILDYAVVAIDTGGHIESWNAGAERAFGYTEDEALGEHTRILFTEDDRKAELPEKEMVLAREQGRAHDDRWHVRKDGSSFFASGTLFPLRDRTATLTGYVKIARDLTERKQYEDAVRTAHNELEIRVEERTRALASANTALGLEVDERRAGEDRVKGLLKRLVTIQEDERRRIARDLHDHLGQQMTAMRLNLESLKTMPDATGELRERVEQTDRIAERLDADVEFLAWELRPAGLDDIGLPGTLSKFLREWSKHYGIAAEFHVSGLDQLRLGSEIETSLYRIAQEALNNIYKHARANRVDVLLERRDGQVILIIEDDGVGFDPVVTVQRSGERGLGVIGMRERTALAGGTLDVESQVGQGTTIFVRVPLGEGAGA